MDSNPSNQTNAEVALPHVLALRRCAVLNPTRSLPETGYWYVESRHSLVHRQQMLDSITSSSRRKFVCATFHLAAWSRTLGQQHATAEAPLTRKEPTEAGTPAQAQPPPLLRMARVSSWLRYFFRFVEPGELPPTRHVVSMAPLALVSAVADEPDGCERQRRSTARNLRDRRGRSDDYYLD